MQADRSAHDKGGPIQKGSTIDVRSSWLQRLTGLAILRLSVSTSFDTLNGFTK
jgi:hypothetical protein